MDYQQAIEKTQEYANLVLQSFQPKMVVLFGSYARGTAHADSDIDVAIIFDALGDQDNILEMSHQLHKLRRTIDSRIEPIIIDLESDRSGFGDTIMRTGKTIYKMTI